MLDAFTEVLVKQASQKQAEDELTEIISKLPIEEAAKLATVGCKTAYVELDDKNWLKKYESTSLFDRAMELEEASLKIEADDLEKRMKDRSERDSTYDKQDMIRLKKRMLDLELHKSGLGKSEKEEDEDEEDEEAPEAPTPVAVDVKEAEANFVRALVHGFQEGLPLVPKGAGEKVAMDEEELQEIKRRAAFNAAIGGAIVPSLGSGIGAGYTEGPGGESLGWGPGAGAFAGSALGSAVGHGLGEAAGLPAGVAQGAGYLGNIGGGALGGYVGAGMKAKKMAREQDRRAALKAEKAARKVEASDTKVAALTKVAFGPMPQPQKPSLGQHLGQTGRGVMNTMKSGATGAIGGGIGGGVLGGLAGAGLSAVSGGNVAQGAMKGMALGGAAGGLAGGAYGAMKGWQQPKVASADPIDLAGRSMAHAFYRLSPNG